MPFERDFFAQNSLIVARALLGALVIRAEPGLPRIVGRIVETEAYTGHDDMASHGRVRRTLRNLPMWEAPGYAYIYLTHGIHWMLNVVTEPAEQPAAVLIRAIEPLEGLDLIASRRTGRPTLDWVRGPGRLTAALNISGAFNRADLTSEQTGLWLEPDGSYPDEAVHTSARIGLGKTPEPWYSIPWRWYVAGNAYVSATRS